MIDLRSIKLFVWDLDDTLWHGTLSEGEITLPADHIQLIKDLTDCGIINSICSKNDYPQVKIKLQELGIWDLFVFPSINWESKGPQLEEKLDKMALRAENVLFIDDNNSNLGEAKHFLPTIQTSGPEIIKELIKQTASLEKKDPSHKRLHQYKILEEKDIASHSFASSEDFLYASHIRVTIHSDCMNQLNRIHELLLRSNQLNYTKKRITIEELEAIIKDIRYNCGYVSVTDKFGDYGIVGFYALFGDRLEHFFFSCRTMGQKIEQWVYAQLGFPKLDVVGEVRTELNNDECPGWINNEGSEAVQDVHNLEDASLASGKVLFKGPCDLSHSVVYIKGEGLNKTEEFTYVTDDGRTIDIYNHSVHIEGLKAYSEEEEKETLTKDCSFIDSAMLSGTFFSGEYDIIFLSTLIESDYLIYQRKGTNLKTVFGGPDLTNPLNWEKYQNGTYYSRGNKFSIEYLKAFAEFYECIGMTTPQSYTSFLEKCLDWLPEKTTICLLLGTTQLYGPDSVRQSHLNLNNAIKEFAASHPRIKYIEFDKCVHDESDFLGGINHFSTRVYYEIAQEMIRVINQVTGKQVRSYSSSFITFDKWVLKVRKLIKSVIKPESGIYKLLLKSYNKVYKHRK